MLVLAHSTVGLQHAAMGIYNAWAGAAPVYMMIGNSLDETHAPSRSRVVPQRPRCGGYGPRLHEVG